MKIADENIDLLEISKYQNTQVPRRKKRFSIPSSFLQTLMKIDKFTWHQNWELRIGEKLPITSRVGDQSFRILSFMPILLLWMYDNFLIIEELRVHVNLFGWCIIMIFTMSGLREIVTIQIFRYNAQCQREHTLKVNSVWKMYNRGPFWISGGLMESLGKVLTLKNW